jgi:hypothetical protein
MARIELTFRAIPGEVRRGSVRQTSIAAAGTREQTDVFFAMIAKGD